ncbi:MAG: hypothetical protein F4Y03_10255 [Alphaproteobacteria bacterium]|nr:hypothetical protein [Alphaproteobacteria bacterium]
MSEAKSNTEAALANCKFKFRNLETRGILLEIEKGDIFLEIKAILGHGNWLPWVRENLDVSVRTVLRSTKIANCRHLRQCSPEHLPTAKSTLVELTRLAPSEFAHLLATGVIHRRMVRGDARMALLGVEQPASKPSSGSFTKDELRFIRDQLTNLDAAFNCELGDSIVAKIDAMLGEANCE